MYTKTTTFLSNPFNIFADSVPDQWTLVTNNQHFRIESNGSLTILNVQNEDSGLYQCQVSNGIGEGLKKTVSISIKGMI